MEPTKKHRVRSTRDQIKDCIARLIGGAQREIVVFAPLLEPYYFNDPAVEQQLIEFALRHKQNRARFLTENIPLLMQSHPRLTNLLRRLDNRLDIRRVAEDAAGQREFFVVADARHFHLQADCESLDSQAEFDAPGPAGQLTRRFEDLWAHSQRIADPHPTGL